MKVKLFQAVVAVSANVTNNRDFSPLEKQINGFLEANPSIEFIDIKFAANAAAVENGPTNYGLCALVMYR